MRKIELLAPAGNMESLIAAVAGGCDAVYLGLQNFSARAFAGNFSHEEYLEAVRFCHIRGVKVYVTVNTMLYETEIANTIKEIDFLYKNDVDALLIQDLGLFHYVRTCYPDLDIHCSTQMHIHNTAGVRFMKEAGAARVVAARETPIEKLKEMCECGIEIEAFVYGAICISYSGQCLMSSAMNHRSANKGVCAQCCRLQYYPAEGEHFREGDYILSPKDLNVIERIPELADAGIASLKIEGRMKRPEYVWMVTRTFREALDAYENGETYRPDAETVRNLMLMFNRGFSEGHIFHNSVRERMSQFRPNHMGIEIGTVVDFRKDRVQVKLSDSLYQHDGLRIINTPKDTGLTAVRIEKDGRLVSEASRGDIVWLDCRSRPFPRRGQKLLKTSDSRLIASIDHMIEDDPRLISVTIEYSAFPGRPLAVTVRDEEGRSVYCESASVCDIPKKAPVTKERLEELLSRTGGYPYRVKDIHGDLGNVFIMVSAVNETRRNALDSLNEIRAARHPEHTEALPYSFNPGKQNEKYPSAIVKTDVPLEDEDNVRCITDQNICPVINENLSEKDSRDGMLLGSAGDLYRTGTGCTAGYTMNIANSYAAAFVLSQPSVTSAVLSSEINDAQCGFLHEEFEKRYGYRPFLYRYVYGKRVLMYVKDRFIEQEIESLTDFNANVFKVTYNKGVTEIREPEVFRAEKGACAGVFIDTDERNTEKIKEIVHEEIS